MSKTEQDAVSTEPEEGEAGKSAKGDGVALPRLGFFGMLRWGWRQLTSMRTALFLLLLLAVAAVPGSLFPQRASYPVQVNKYLQDHATIGPWLDHLQLFDVYSSVWFSAIYLLLFVSLIGCVIPRTRQHWKAMRTPPPRTPRRFSRLPEYRTIDLPESSPTPAEAIGHAAAMLKKRGYRIELRADGAEPSVAAERGLFKEIGNLLFHTALIGVLASVAIGGLFGYTGQRIVVEGDTFVNTLVSYDSFSPGTDFQSSQLAPYSLKLDSLKVTYDTKSTSHLGQPLSFDATITTKDGPNAPSKTQHLKVNEPINIGGTTVYLVGNGYAPVITVRDGQGKVVFHKPVVTLPNDSMNTSLGVIKVPDAKPSQLGFVGFLLPTAFVGPNGVAYSQFPDLYNPQLNLNSYYGDLGLSSGKPQSVYALDKSKMTQLNGRNLPAGGITLTPGQTYKLPQGKGSITLDGIKRYAALDIHHDPTQSAVFIFVLLAIAGLVGSLFIPRRRLWVKAVTSADGRTLIEVGALARGEDYRLSGEADSVRNALATSWGLPKTSAAKPNGGSTTRSESAQSKEK